MEGSKNGTCLGSGEGLKWSEIANGEVVSGLLGAD
jgi:hypothetical protein